MGRGGGAELRGVAAAEEPVRGGRQRVCANPSTLGTPRMSRRGSAGSDGSDGLVDRLGVVAEPGFERRGGT